MRFARSETRRRGVTLSEFLVDIRAEVERQALARDRDAAEPALAEEAVS